jgi:hypothetical protein
MSVWRLCAEEGRNGSSLAPRQGSVATHYGEPRGCGCCSLWPGPLAPTGTFPNRFHTGEPFPSQKSFQGLHTHTLDDPEDLCGRGERVWTFKGQNCGFAVFMTPPFLSLLFAPPRLSLLSLLIPLIYSSNIY